MNLRIWSPKIRVPVWFLSQRLLRPSRCWGLAKAQKQRRPINAFLDSKSWVADAKRKDLGFKSTTLCLTIFVIWPQRRWLEKVKRLYGAVLSQHTVAPRLDARASRVVKDHRSVELRILQRPNVLSMSSIHSVTPKHGLSRTRCSNALLHLVPTWCHDFRFFDFFLGGCTIKGFLPPWATSVARRALWHWGGDFMQWQFWPSSVFCWSGTT